MNMHTAKTYRHACDVCDSSGIVNDDDGMPRVCGGCMGNGWLYRTDQPLDTSDVPSTAQEGEG